MKKHVVLFFLGFFTISICLADTMTSFMKVPFSATKEEAKQILIDNGFKVKDKVGIGKNPITKQKYNYNYLEVTKKGVTYAGQKLKDDSLRFHYTDDNRLSSISLYFDNDDLHLLKNDHFEWLAIQGKIIQKYGLSREMDNVKGYNKDSYRIVTDSENVVITFSQSFYSISIAPAKIYFEKLVDSAKKDLNKLQNTLNSIDDDI